jgi:hypothetical protein
VAATHAETGVGRHGFIHDKRAFELSDLDAVRRPRARWYSAAGHEYGVKARSAGSNAQVLGIFPSAGNPPHQMN